MRYDMDKVIVERPRLHGGDRDYRRTQRARDKHTEEDLLLKNSGMRKSYVRSSMPKILNENLSPLRRFLKSKIGHPWNKIYSEIRKRISTNSTVQLHILQHVEGYVEEHIVKDEDGNLTDGKYPLRKGDMYVDKHGILSIYNGPKKNKLKLKKGEKIYVLYKEVGGISNVTHDIITHWYKYLVISEVEYDSLSPGKKREVLYKFVAGSMTEALDEIDQYKKRYHT